MRRRRQHDADGLREKQHLVNKSQTSKTRKNLQFRPVTDGAQHD